MNDHLARDAAHAAQLGRRWWEIDAEIMVYQDRQIVGRWRCIQAGEDGKWVYESRKVEGT